MPPVTANSGELWQVLIQGRIEEQICENVLWFRAQAADTDVILHLLTAVLTCFATNILPVLAGTYTFEQIVGRRMTPDVGPDFIVTQAPGAENTGAAAGDAEPSFVSALISLRTTRGGRSGRGRMFLAGVPEGSTTASHLILETGLYPAMVAFVGCMIAQFLTKDVPAAGNWEWGVFSRKLGGVKAPFNAAGFAPMLSAVPKIELATTRSRKLGHGR
jgi:hypothetical protein